MSVATFRTQHTQALKQFLARNIGNQASIKGSAASPSGAVLARLSPLSLAHRLLAIGVYAPSQLLERAVRVRDLAAEAAQLRLRPEELHALYERAIAQADPAVVANMRRLAEQPEMGGQMDENSDEFRLLNASWRAPAVDLDASRLGRWIDDPEILLLSYTLESVDMRPYLGPARNQASRGSCYSFGSTAVVEALEFLRDRRAGPRDLSEQMVFWYSKRGQLNSAGGGSCMHALQSYCDYGACEEAYYPYEPNQMSYNHAHVPAPDTAIDRAGFYRGDEVVSLTKRDVAEAKEVLRSGRCIGFVSDTTGWLRDTGSMTFPNPLDAMAPGSSHCTTIIGFADRPGLPAEWEGGYFILRNSHGRAHSPLNHMGEEYGGHLRMPYGWYRRYGNGVYTLADETRQDQAARLWRVEYFANKTLKGVPAHVANVETLNFDWGVGSPVAGLPAEDFSARFTQIRRLRAGWYRFRLTGNNGIRLWVDDRMVINRWWDSQNGSGEETHYVSGGDHVLRVEYYEHVGSASVSLDITPVQFTYQLFPNSTLSGAPTVTFEDTSNRMEWRHVPPVSTILSNGRMSLRATATVAFLSGRYRFNAVHTGGCRIFLDGVKVLDDWDGLTPLGAAVEVAAGNRQVVVEFRHTEQIPALDAGSIYRSALTFGWADDGWLLTCHNYDEANAILDAGYPDPDSRYQMFRVIAFNGSPEVNARLDAAHNVANEYLAVDGMPLRIRFADIEQFKTGINGSDDLETDWLSAHIRRNVFIAETGRYQFRINADDGHRLIVDGRQLEETHFIIGGHDRYFELDLEAGCHDIALEYCNSKWGGSLDMEVTRAAWTVDYYDGADFATHLEQKTLDRLDRIPLDVPAAAGATHWSARAVRTYDLPVGRYRIYARGDDGVRVRVARQTLIDAWKNQSSTGYSAHFEHHGGPIEVEVDYYQATGATDFDYKLLPDGFFGEYYRGMTLDKSIQADGSEKPNPPHAYRFDPWIDFDWGSAPAMPRLGRDAFSARWWGPLDLPVGRWRFDLTGDDGFRLFLDGRLLIDAWVNQPATTHSAQVDLVGREHNLQLEYYENTVNAVCKLHLERLF